MNNKTYKAILVGVGGEEKHMKTSASVCAVAL